MQNSLNKLGNKSVGNPRVKPVHFPILHTAYLMWLHPNPAVDIDDLDMDNGEDSNVELEPSTSMSPKHWYIVKHPAFHNVMVNYLETCHRIPDFLDVFSDFFKKYSLHAPQPSKYDCFNVYKQVHVILPLNNFMGSIQVEECICTTPACNTTGQ